MKDIPSVTLETIPWWLKPAKTKQQRFFLLRGVPGRRKGCYYTHGIFNAQIHHIQSHFGISSDEIDLPNISAFCAFEIRLWG
jgi:hypothetical protein